MTANNWRYYIFEHDEVLLQEMELMRLVEFDELILTANM